VNFALRSTISRWRGISRIRPGYPICVAAGKLAHFFIADPVSSLAGASVASTFSYWTDATRVGRFPAVHADRGLVGVALSRAVPASGGSRRSTCRARRRQCIAFVPSRRRTREGPARSPLWTGSRRSIQPRSFIQTPCDATRCSGPTPCVVLLARRRNEIGTKSDARAMPRRHRERTCSADDQPQAVRTRRREGRVVPGRRGDSQQASS